MAKSMKYATGKRDDSQNQFAHRISRTGRFRVVRVVAYHRDTTAGLLGDCFIAGAPLRLLGRSARLWRYGARRGEGAKK